MMYGPDALRLPQLIHRAATTGDVHAFAEYYWRRERSLWPALSQGLHLSVFCTEDVPFIGDDEAQQATAGTFLGSYVVDDYRRACRVWPRGRVPDDFFRPVTSDRPVLILAGRRDPSTPPATARRVLATLSQGLLVVHRYGGHGFTGSRDRACQARIMEEFLARGSVDGLDAACVEGERPLPFVIEGDPRPSPSQDPADGKALRPAHRPEQRGAHQDGNARGAHEGP
jgi:pimeloyl-ACP methyl ester carboxylesterase